MSKKPLIIELFIWFVFLTLVFCAISFAYSKMFVEPNIYNIDFADIDGITKGSPVRFMGMNVGYVRSLKSKNKHIQVQIIITSKNMKIPNGTAARVEFYGLGGSKSIELMPPDGSCDVGIITNHTIRIAEIAKEVFSIVEIVEGLDKYVKGLNKSKLQHILEATASLKDDKIRSANNNIDNMQSDVIKKAYDIKTRQKEITDDIKSANNNVERLNQFIYRFKK